MNDILKFGIDVDSRNAWVNIGMTKEKFEELAKSALLPGESIDELKQKLAALQTIGSKMTIGSEAFKNVQAEATKTSAVIQQSMRPALENGIIRPTGSARMALVGMSQTLSDSNMFMVNFRMGMMSIGNNIDFVTQSLARVKEEAAASGQTMRQALGAALTGPTGIMIGINALVVALQVLPTLFERAVKSSMDAADGFYSASLRATRAFTGYGNKLEARSMDLTQFSEKRLQSEVSTHSAILMEVARRKQKEEEILALMKDQGKENDDDYKRRESNVSLLEKQYNDEFRFLKSIGDEFERRRKESEKTLDAEKKLQEKYEKWYRNFSEDSITKLGKGKKYLPGLDVPDVDVSGDPTRLQREFLLNSMQTDISNAKAREMALTHIKQDGATARIRAERNAWREEHMIADAAISAIGTAWRQMWTDSLLVHRQAKDTGDAIWLATENTVIGTIGNVIAKMLEEAATSYLISSTTTAATSAQMAALAATAAPAALAVNIASFGAAGWAAAASAAAAGAALAGASATASAASPLKGANLISSLAGGASKRTSTIPSGSGSPVVINKLYVKSEIETPRLAKKMQSVERYNEVTSA